MAKKDEVKETQTPEPEGTPTTVEPVDWEAKAKEFETELANTKKGLGTAHSTIAERDKALKEAQDIRGLLDGLTTKVDIHGAYIDEMSSRTGEDYEPEEPKRGNKSLDDRIKEIEGKTRVTQVNLYAQEAEKLAKEAGLDIRTAPELKGVRWGFGYQDPVLAREALEDLRSIVDAKKPKETEVIPVEEKPKETEAEMKERIKREIMEERGELTPEGITPTGTGGSDDEFLKALGEYKRPMTKADLDRYKKITSSY